MLELYKVHYTNANYMHHHKLTHIYKKRLSVNLLKFEPYKVETRVEVKGNDVTQRVYSFQLPNHTYF